MNRIDRKTLFTLIAGLVAFVLLGIIIVISILTSQNTSEPEATPEPNSTSSVQEEEITEPGVSGDPEAGSDTIYDNDYSADEGYEKLPIDFDPNVSAKENTIYDDAYVAATGARLMCEFSNKRTVTERSLRSIENFYSDLGLSGSDQALATRAEYSSFLKKYKSQIGSRLDVSEADMLSVYNCDYGNLDHEHPTE